MSAIEWPLPEEVAKAIVAGARLEGEDPVLTAEGAHGMRGRVYAFLALGRMFPFVSRVRLGALVGSRGAINFPTNCRTIVLSKGGIGWFDLSRLNQLNEECGWPPMTLEEAREATYTRAAPESVSSAPQEQEPPAPPGVEEIDLPARPSVAVTSAGRALAAAAAAMSEKKRVRAAPEPPPQAVFGSFGARVVTAEFCGDPPPGRSALDQRNREREP